MHKFLMQRGFATPLRPSWGGGSPYNQKINIHYGRNPEKGLRKVRTRTHS